jgi:endonuclease I
MFFRLLVALSFLSTLAWADPNQVLPNGRLAYYGNQDFNKSNDVKKTLFAILNSYHQTSPGQVDRLVPGCEEGKNCYRHTSVGYNRARVIIFGELDVQRDDQGQFVEEVYCRKKIYFRDARDITRMNSIVNIEHTWPQSKFTRQFNTDLQKSDMHHLYPTDSKANGIRGNHDFGEPDPGFTNNALCDASQIERVGGGYIFAPPAEHRGNVARSLFYFSVRYQMPIDAKQERTLREWHEQDPIDAEEIERHNLIARHQKVRNPFIDHPHLVTMIGDF